VRQPGAQTGGNDQSKLDKAELARIVESYFPVFPRDLLLPKAEGSDMGCGSGSRAKLALSRVGCSDCSGGAGLEALKALKSVKSLKKLYVVVGLCVTEK
jgi:hypothetical protein